MKVLRIHAVGDLRLHDEPMPQLMPDDALVRVKAVGICGSDIHWSAEGTTGEDKIEVPFILGHEFGGQVEGGIMDGLRVAVDPALPCEVCEFCRRGDPNLCPDQYFAGHPPQDGALREYLPWPLDKLIPLPDFISDEDAAMLEPLGVAIYNVELGQVQPGMIVGVYGCGPSGLLTIQVARAAGASQIIATDVLPHRLEAARALGADVYLASPQGNERTPILVNTHKLGVDVAFETAGENAAVETAVETAKPGGRVVLCGIPIVNQTAFRASAARRKGLTIQMVRRMKHTYPRAIKLVETGQVELRSIVSHRFGLDQAAEAFSVAQKREGLKVVITP